MSDYFEAEPEDDEAFFAEEEAAREAEAAAAELSYYEEDASKKRPPPAPTENDDHVVCTACGQKCSELTSRSKSNPNRKFYKCTCGYFKWADELASPPTAPPAVGGDDAIPQQECPECRAACDVRTSHSVNNPNRKYYKCHCGYFNWCDTAAPSSPKRRKISSTSQNNSQPQQQQIDPSACYKCGESGHYARDCPKATSTEKTCYKCGQPGHYARDCQFSSLAVAPISSAGSSSSACYRCGKSGHYARDCPTYTSGRVGVGSFGNCYKCNQSGHFARDCTNQQQPESGGARAWNRMSR